VANVTGRIILVKLTVEVWYLDGLAKTSARAQTHPGCLYQCTKIVDTVALFNRADQLQVTELLDVIFGARSDSFERKHI
jgi:hypothetical protein